MSAAPAAAGRLAVVGFAGHAELAWLRLLKPGFRHCLVALHEPAGWIVYDPLAHATEFALLPLEAAADPFAWLLGHGYLPVPARRRPPLRRPLAPAPFTCVEAVKRALGLRAPLVLTPWQLFRRLVDDQKIVLDMVDD